MKGFRSLFGYQMLSIQLARLVTGRREGWKQGKLPLCQVHHRPHLSLTGVNVFKRWSPHYTHLTDKDGGVREVKQCGGR